MTPPDSGLRITYTTVQVTDSSRHHMRTTPNPAFSEVLPRGNILNRPELGGLRTHEGPDVDDLFAFGAGNPRPIIRICGVRQILVLLELLLHGVEEVVQLDAFLFHRQVAFQGRLFCPRDNVLDHRSTGKVLEVKSFSITLSVRDFEKLVLIVRAVHMLTGILDQPGHSGLPVR